MSDILDELVSMSRALGEPANDYAILGEGNTSARADGETFWVKASGTQLGRADRDSFVRVNAAPILAAIDGPPIDDEAVRTLLKKATVQGARAPSIETFLHAMCLRLDGICFVGHAHPTVALGLLCGGNSRELFSGCMFPDQVVVLGPAFAYVPYADPGLPLALAVEQAIRGFLDEYGRTPKIILMENHGAIALGSSSQDVLNAMQMLVKTCRILVGTLAAGGPRFLSRAHVDRIDKRPDELARRRDFV